MDKKQTTIDKLAIYNQLANTPQEARKEISAGRLKGMTDINPMWRIKKLTETFGICGIGWKYIITSKRLENGCNGQISAFVDIELFVKIDDTWSDAIPGTGGSSFVTQEKNGLYQSDECFKMALTDAISVCCKALGMSSDIYFSKERTKYDNTNENTPAPAPVEKKWLNLLNKEGQPIHAVLAKLTTFFSEGKSIEELEAKVKISKADMNFIVKHFNLA